MQYDPTVGSPELYRQAVSKLGYSAQAPSNAQSKKVVSRQLSLLYVPKDAPDFFINATENAKAARRPIVMDFWAKWCAACLQLKRETLEDPDVAKALSIAEVIYVDLDQYPALGEAYGVAAIPDLFFIDKSGRIVDRLQNFEPPKAFVARVRKNFGLPMIRDAARR